MAGRPGTRRGKKPVAGEESPLPGSTATGTCSVVEISDGDRAKLLELSTELSELELRNAGKNYDLDSCLSSVQLVMNLSSNSFENTAHLADPELYRRLLKNISRSILSGAWTVVPSANRTMLNNSLSAVAAILENNNFHNEARYCWTGCHLINASPWQDEQINKVLNEAVILDNVNRLFDLEGWIFIESRIELLCKLDAERLAHLLEACLMKGQIWYPDLKKEKITRNLFKMPQEKYYQLAAMFAIILYRHTNDEDNPFSRFEPYFSVPLVTGAAQRLLDSDNPHRVQPTWKNWKHAKPVAIELVLRQLQILNENPTSIPELKAFFKFYAKLLHFVSQDYSGELGAAALHDVFDTRVSQDPPKSLVQSVLDFSNSEGFEKLIRNSVTNNHTYAFADAILELCGPTEPVLNKVVELYITELTEEVRHRINMQSMGDKEVTDSLSQVISRRFDSLAHYFEFDSQICFEILLSSFSLNPTPAIWYRIVNMVDSPSDESAKVDVNMKISASMHSKARLSSGVFIDLTNLIQGVRAARLTCFRDSWTRFKTVCENHLSTRGDDIKGVDDLALAKPTDFSAYIGMKPAYDDNDAGYEAGYLPVEDEEGEPDPVPVKKAKKIREPAFRMKMFLEGSAPSTSSLFLAKKKNSSSKQVGGLVKKAKGLKSLKFKPEVQLKVSNKLLSRKVNKPIAQVKKVRCDATANQVNPVRRKSLPEVNYEEPQLQTLDNPASQKRKSTSKSKTKPFWPPRELFAVTKDGDVVLPCIPKPFASGGKTPRYTNFDQALETVPYLPSPTVLSMTQSHPLHFPNHHQSHVLASSFPSAVEELLAFVAAHDYFPSEKDSIYSQSSEEWAKFLDYDVTTREVTTLPSSRPMVGRNPAENESIEEPMEQNVSESTIDEPLIEIPMNGLKMDLECQNDTVGQDLLELPDVNSDSRCQHAPSLETVYNCPDSPGLQGSCSNCMGSLLDQLSESSLSESCYSRAQASTECSPITSPENSAGTRLCLSVTTGKLVREEYDSDSNLEVEDCETYSISGFSDHESDPTALREEDDIFDGTTSLPAEEEPRIEVLSDVTGDVVSVKRSDGNRTYLSETVGVFFELDPKQLENLFSHAVDQPLPPFEGFVDPVSSVFSPNQSISEPDEDFFGPTPVHMVLPMHIKVMLYKLTDQEVAKYKKVSVPTVMSVPTPTATVPVKAAQRRKSCPSPTDDAPSEKKLHLESAETRRSNRICRTPTFFEDIDSISSPSSHLSLHPVEKPVEKKSRLESNPQRSHKRKLKEPIDFVIVNHQKETKAERIHNEERVNGMKNFQDILLRENEEKELKAKIKVIENGLKEKGMIMLIKPECLKRSVSTPSRSKSSNRNHHRPPAKRAKTSQHNPGPQVHKNPPKAGCRKVSTVYDVADHHLNDEAEVPSLFQDDDLEIMPESESDSEDEVKRGSFAKHVRSPLSNEIKWHKIVPDGDEMEPHVQDVDDYEIDPLAIESHEVITIDDSSEESETEAEGNQPEPLNFPLSLEVTFYKPDQNGIRANQNEQPTEDRPPNYILPFDLNPASLEPHILPSDSDNEDIIVPDFLEISEVVPEPEIILVSPPPSVYQSSIISPPTFHRTPTPLPVQPGPGPMAAEGSSTTLSTAVVPIIESQIMAASEQEIPNEYLQLPEIEITTTPFPEPESRELTIKPELEITASSVPEREIPSGTAETEVEGTTTAESISESGTPSGNTRPELDIAAMSMSRPEPETQDETTQQELEITITTISESEILNVATQLELDLPVSCTCMIDPEIPDATIQSVEVTTAETIPEQEVTTGTAELEITIVAKHEPMTQKGTAPDPEFLEVAQHQHEPELPKKPTSIPELKVPDGSSQPELQITTTWTPERRTSMEMPTCPVEPTVTPSAVSHSETSASAELMPNLVEPAISATVKLKTVEVDTKNNEEMLNLMESNTATDEDEREMPELDLAETTGAYYGEDYPDAPPPRLQREDNVNSALIIENE